MGRAFLGLGPGSGIKAAARGAAARKERGGEGVERSWLQETLRSDEGSSATEEA